MVKEDTIYYIKLALGLLLISPLVFMFWYLDKTVLESLLRTGGMYAVLIPLGWLGFNYLTYGKLWVTKKYLKDNTNKRGHFEMPIDDI